MKQRRTQPSRMLPPVRNPKELQQTPSGRPVGWIEGYAGTPRKNLSAHQLRAALVAAGAPVVLASPLPGVTALVTTSQLSDQTWVTAGTVEVSGVHIINFLVKNISANENGILVRPFRLIDAERFVDDAEAPYYIPSGLGVRIPVVCDCEVVGLEVKDFVAGSHALYTVGVGMTP